MKRWNETILSEPDGAGDVRKSLPKSIDDGAGRDPRAGAGQLEFFLPNHHLAVVIVAAMNGARQSQHALCQIGG